MGRSYKKSGMVVFTRRSTTAGTFHPITGFMEITEEGLKLKGDIEVEEHTGDATVQLAYRVADDITSPSVATAFGSSRTTVGRSYDGSWTSVAAATNANKHLQLGVWAINTVGTTQDMARVNVNIAVQK